MVPQVEQDFLAFRRSGDTRALARVFDALAPELLLVAAHLGRDRARAEDIVQDTFLAAIQSAASYDDAQALRPWLIGILVRKAKVIRRREARAPDPGRLAPQQAVDPTAEAEALELARSLGETIRSLPMPYRQVLNLHLVHDHAAVDIARILERSPDTVHTQLRRGMEMLRKALPTGFALPAIALFGGRGLAAVRAAVLQGAKAAAVGSAAAAFGGVFVMKKLLVSGCVAALAVLAWWQWSDSPPGEPPVEREVSAVPPLSGDLEALDVEGGETAGREPVEVDAAATLAKTGEDQDLLRGIVLTPEGEPIADAEVKLQQRDTQGFTFLDLEYNHEVQEVARTRSDEDGGFRFRARRFRAYGVQVRAWGYAPMTLLECRVGEEYEIRLQPAAVLEGQVTRSDDHSPVAGARLELFTHSGFRAETTTDGRGMYRFESVLAGEVNLSVYPIVEMHVFSQLLVVEAGETLRHDVRVEPGGVLRGTVVDGVTGQPIGNAEVSASWTFNRSARTDAVGQYVLTGFTGRGSTQVVARAKGYGRMEQDMPARVGQDNEMDFRLMPATAVRGRVLDAAGEPAQGVYVAAMGYYQPGPLGGNQDWQSDRTGEDGRYLVNDLRTDLVHALIVRRPGSGVLVYDFPRNPAAGEVLDLGDVFLRPGATIEGRVVDGEGRGMSGVWIELAGNNRDRFRYFEGGSAPDGHVSPGGHYLRERQSVSGPRGTFSITDLSPGAYRVRALFEGKWTAAVEVTIRESGEVRDGVALQVQKKLSIQGQVVAPEGETIQEGIVEMYREDDGRYAGDYFGTGSFEVKGLDPGRYTVWVRLMGEPARRWVSERVTGVEAGATEVRVTVKPVDVIEGVVRDAEGAPVAGISVQARVQEVRPRIRGPVLTASDGRFRLRVGAGEIVDVLAGPQRVDDRLPPSVVRSPDPALAVTRKDVIAGTRDLVIQLR